MVAKEKKILAQTLQQHADSLLHNTTSCTKFQNPRPSSSWEIFDTNFPMYYMGVRDGKMEKDGENKSQHLVFCPTKYLATLKVYTKYKIWELWLS